MREAYLTIRSLVRNLQRRKRSLLGRSRDWALPTTPAAARPLPRLLDDLGRPRALLDGLDFGHLTPVAGVEKLLGAPTLAALLPSLLLRPAARHQTAGLGAAALHLSSGCRMRQIHTAAALPSAASEVAADAGTTAGLLEDVEDAAVHHQQPTAIHPSAIVDPAATLGCGVQIGPFCMVGPDVVLGDGVRLHSHVVVDGHTHIGDASTVFSHATVGAAPQDRKHTLGERSELHIGQRCRIFEYAHLSGGTRAGGGLTSIGDNCMVMSHTHVGHDCSLGSNVVLASGSALAGHVVVGDHATISGHSCVHQRVSIGRGAFVAGASVLVDDLIPFGLAIGNRAQVGPTVSPAELLSHPFDDGHLRLTMSTHDARLSSTLHFHTLPDVLTR